MVYRGYKHNRQPLHTWAEVTQLYGLVSLSVLSYTNLTQQLAD